MQDIRKLLVWQKAHLLTLRVYDASKVFPGSEIYGLTAQLRRACLSVELNIAEGTARGRPAQLSSFLDIAAGSAAEVDCALEVSRDLQFLHPSLHSDLARNVTEVRKMLWSLSEKVRAV